MRVQVEKYGTQEDESHKVVTVYEGEEMEEDGEGLYDTQLIVKITSSVGSQLCISQDHLGRISLFSGSTKKKLLLGVSDSSGEFSVHNIDFL